MAGIIADASSLNWNTGENELKKIRLFFDGRIDLDPCSNASSTVGASLSYTLPVNGLEQPWHGNVYVNPPYGETYLTDHGAMTPSQWRQASSSMPDIKLICRSNINHWHQKCAAEMIQCCRILELIPAAVGNVIGWHSIIWPKATAVAFLRGRPRFSIPGRKGSGGTQDIAVILWSMYDGDLERFADAFSEDHVVIPYRR